MAGPEVVAGLLRAKLAEEGAACWRASGRSMAGAIADGATVVLRPLGPGELRPGLVVMAELPYGLAVHRVRRVVSGLVHLRGDARRRCDPPVSLDAVIGAVEAAPPFRRRSLLYRLVP